MPSSSASAIHGLVRGACRSLPGQLRVLSAGMRRDDRVGDEPGRVEMNDALWQPPFGGGQRMDRISDGNTLEYRIRQHSRRLSHKEAVGGRRESPRRPRLAATAGGALQSGPRADQIIEEDRRAIAHLANQQVTGDNAAAAAFFDECRGRFLIQLCRQSAAELFGPLGAADIRRNNSNLFVPQQTAEMLDEKRYGLEIGHRAAKRVL